MSRGWLAVGFVVLSVIGLKAFTFAAERFEPTAPARTVRFVSGPSAPVVEDDSKDFTEGLARGRAEADAEVAAGAPTIYTYGMLPPSLGLDPEAGLPYKAIAGCILGRFDQARAQGHNERILELNRTRGPLPGSFQQWLDVIRQPAGFLEGKTPKTVALDGHDVASPDDATTIRLVPARHPPGDDVPGAWVELEVRKAGTAVVHARALIGRIEGTDVELVFGPKGSGFAVVRYRSLGAGEAARPVRVLDLRRGGWLGLR